MSALPVTFFENRAATTKREEQLSLDALAKLIRTTSATGKDRLPWLKLAQFGDLPSEQNCLRWDGNVVAVNGIEADYDGEKMPFEDAVEILEKEGIEAIVYTSPSHTAERPRWRVLCPFSQELPPAERARMLARLNGLFGGIFSPESWAISQSYFFGSVNGNPEHRVVVIDGLPIDQDQDLDLIAIDKPAGKPATGAPNGHAAPSNGGDQTRSGRAARAAIAAMPASLEAMTALLRTHADPEIRTWAENDRQLARLWTRVVKKRVNDHDAWLAAIDAVENKVPLKESAEPATDPLADLDARSPPPEPGEPDWIIDRAVLAGAEWLKRDIPLPDYLLGELLSTTCRVEVIGPTGLGKTNVLLAVALAVADGSDFLHWRGRGDPRRVLFVDGEMSRRLAKQRLVDATRRHGGMPDGFFYLNREDFPDMQPLNTEAGQKFIDRVIEVLGGFDLVIFDNVQALLAGDDSFGAKVWENTLPWVRSLTLRNIGQVWVHHTGRDETHAWGTSTREWQLDTVALMERVERADADIAFKLSFTKARERTPDNRSDFDPTIITLADDQWNSDRGGDLRPKKRQTHKSRGLELLIDALARGNGEIPPASSRIPPHTYCLNEDLWRKLFVDGSFAETTESAERAFRRTATDLLNAGQIGKWRNWIWPCRP